MITRYEALRLAQDAGITPYCTPATIERFTQAAYERGLEDAAKVAQGYWDGRQEKLWAETCADAIRALGSKQ